MNTEEHNVFPSNEDYTQIMNEYHEEMDKIHAEERRVNDRILKAIKAIRGEMFYKELLELINDSCVNGMLKIVNSPKGDKQSSGQYIIHEWVDQRTGYEVDDYYGTITVQIKKGKYLQMDYSM